VQDLGKSCSAVETASSAFFEEGKSGSTWTIMVLQIVLEKY
jgi:hypothetical protein